jgi:hypothetical protein
VSVSERTKVRIAELRALLQDGKFDQWHLALVGKAFPKKSSDELAEWILSNKNEAAVLFGKSVVDMFELSILNWVSSLKIEIRSDEEIFDSVLENKKSEPWSSFLRDWGVILVGGSVAAQGLVPPCYVKFYKPHDPFCGPWRCSDGITPKVYRLPELVHREYKYWDSEIWSGEQDEVDEFEVDFDPINHVPKDVLASIAIGHRSDLDSGGFACIAGGFGFKDGEISFIGLEHDEWVYQQANLK